MSEFIGLPIEGEIRTVHSTVAQKPIGKLAELLKEVLSSPLIYAIRWMQYTPYFNDGDPCVFSAHELSLRLTSLEENDDRGDGGDGFFESYEDEYKAILGGTKWNSLTGERHNLKCPNPELAAMVKRLNDALTCGAHDIALANMFGDHAMVTATPEKFIIDEYEHD